MSTSDQLESKLSEIFEKQAPKLPTGGKQAIVKYLPWGSLILGLFTLWAAWALWSLAHTAATIIDAANQFSAYYGGPTVATADMTLWVWLGIAVLVAEGVLYLVAFPGLRDHKKSGWNYLYYGALLNLVYAVVSLFMGYDSFSRFLGALIGSVIGFWLLFQIRSSYTGERAARVKSK